MCCEKVQRTDAAVGREGASAGSGTSSPSIMTGALLCGQEDTNNRGLL